MSSPKESWFARLFSGKKKNKSEATLAASDTAHAHSNAPRQPHKQTTAEQQAAMDAIARKSALVRTSCQKASQRRSTDLMGELADDFLRLKDTAPGSATNEDQAKQAQE